MLFNKNNKNNEDLERIYEKVNILSEDIGVLAKNMVSLSITVNKALGELNKQLPQFAETIVSEVNNSLEDFSIEKGKPCVDYDVQDNNILLVYQKIGTNKHMRRVYKPHNLYFDGYNFINRIGANRGKISFTIDDVKFFNENLGSVCETLVENNYRFSIVYNETSISKNVFPKLLFNIIDGTFNDIERFKENPIKKIS